MGLYHTVLRLILTVDVHAAAEVLLPRRAELYVLYACEVTHPPRVIHWIFSAHNGRKNNNRPHSDNPSQDQNKDNLCRIVG